MSPDSLPWAREETSDQQGDADLAHWVTSIGLKDWPKNLQLIRIERIDGTLRQLMMMEQVHRIQLSIR